MALHAADLLLLVIEGPVGLLELLRQHQVIHGAAEEDGIEPKTLQTIHRETVRLAAEKNDEAEWPAAIVTGYAGQRSHPFQMFPRWVVGGHLQPIDHRWFARIEELA